MSKLRIISGIILILSLVFLISWVGIFTPSPSSPHAPDWLIANWADTAYWDDGLAEVNIYDAEQVIYRKTRQFTTTHIVVKEDFNKEFWVKTDDYQRKDLFPVLKLNQVYEIPTDNYPYAYMVSVFLDRYQISTAKKMTVSSQDWCGMTFKEYLPREDGYAFIYHSYWDGQGDGQSDIHGEFLFEEQLVLSLRALKFEDGLTFQANVLPFQATTRAAQPAPYEANFSVHEADSLWHVRMETLEGTHSDFWFQKGFPHVLQKMETADGRRLALRQTYRDDYWRIKKAPAQ